MKLFTVDNDYVTYLKQFDKNVLYNENDNYKRSRKYLGILLEINECKYLAPLSSPKKSDYFSNGKIRHSITVIIRLTKENKLLGTVKLSNMIPIFDERVIEYYDIKKENDLKYKNLVLDELKFINENKEFIIKNAKRLYKQKTLKLDIGYIENTIDFHLLEEKSKKYVIK